MRSKRFKVTIPKIGEVIGQPTIPEDIKRPKKKSPTGTKQSNTEKMIIDRLNHNLRALEKSGYSSSSYFYTLVFGFGRTGKLNIGFTKDDGMRIRMSNKDKKNDPTVLEYLIKQPSRTIRGIKKQVGKMKTMIEEVEPEATADIPQAKEKWSTEEVEKIRKRYQILSEAGYSSDSTVVWDMAERLRDVSVTRVRANMATWNAAMVLRGLPYSIERSEAILSANSDEQAQEYAKIKDKDFVQMRDEVRKVIDRIVTEREKRVAEKKLRKEIEASSSRAEEHRRNVLKMLGRNKDMFNL